MYLIDSIGLYPQSAVTLYIYRVGKTYPARNPVYRSKSMKNPSCTRTLPRPVRPVGPTGQTGRSLPDRPQCLDRSDRSVRPVGANFDCQHKSNKVCLSTATLAIKYQRGRSCARKNGSTTAARACCTAAARLASPSQ